VPTIVVASDAPTVRREVAEVVRRPDLSIIEVASGPELLASVTAADPPDLVVVDLQMANMGGVAVAMELRLEESYGALPHIPVLLLLDRRPDVFMARRSGVEGWLIKPLDPLRLRRAVRAMLAGDPYEDDSYQPMPVLVTVDDAEPDGTPDQAAAGAAER
jgi:CheY-like chemotaxis protein